MTTHESTLQRDLFLASEGDGWFRQNRESFMKKSDRVVSALQAMSLRPARLLEVGCSNGCRLSRIHALFGTECHGIDPSTIAIEDGKATWPELDLRIGTADALGYPDESFDTIILGFCLYLCDRRHLFKIACEADRCLRDGGTMVVSDFCPPFPYKNPYLPREGMFSYKMDYSRLFSWNPDYVETCRLVHVDPAADPTPDRFEAVVMLRKSGRHAYPTEPFGPRTSRADG
jgi:SAM-dependent methyltransferase